MRTLKDKDLSGYSLAQLRLERAKFVLLGQQYRSVNSFDTGFGMMHARPEKQAEIDGIVREFDLLIADRLEA